MLDAEEVSAFHTDGFVRVERLIPDFLWIDTVYTAKVSLDGLERNKMRVVPGLTSKAMSAASGYAPRSVVAPIVGAVYKKLGGS